MKIQKTIFYSLNNFSAIDANITTSINIPTSVLSQSICLSKNIEKYSKKKKKEFKTSNENEDWL